MNPRYHLGRWLLTMLFVLPLVAGAQNSLSGIVTDRNTGEPLPGASVFFHDLKTGTLSDSAGRYRIGRLPRGRFLLEVRYASYHSFVQEVNVEGTASFDIALEKSVAELHEVLVTGTASATSSTVNPVPVTIVNRQALNANPSSNIIEAIARVPGVSQVSTGAAISKPVIRGLGFNRVVTLNNGIRQEGQQWGDEHGIEIDAYGVERAEIIKGPGSLLYGSDALAGVLNMITTQPMPEGKIAGTVSSEYQTNNGLIGYSLMNAGSLHGVSWQARYSGKHAGNYRNRYDGRVYNSGFSEQNFSGFAGFSGRHGYIQLHGSSFSQRTGIIEGTRDSTGAFTKGITEDSMVTVDASELNSYAVHVPYQDISHKRVMLVGQLIAGKMRLSATTGYQLSERKEFGDPVQPESYGLHFYMPTWTSDVRTFFPEIKGWKPSAGISGMWQEHTNKGTEFLIPDYNLFDAGGYVLLQKQAGRLNMSGGIRYDTRTIESRRLVLDASGVPSSIGSLKFAGFSAQFRNFAASAGFTYEADTNIIFKLNVSRGFRAPNLAELASNGRHEGTYRYEIGNPGLEAETSVQIDPGLEVHLEHATVELSVFSSRIDNYIFATRLPGALGGDSISDPSDPVPSYRFTQANAELYGGELSIDIHPPPLAWLHFENSIAIVNGEISGLPDSTKFLPLIPPPRLRSELRASFFEKGKLLRNAFIKVNSDHFLPQDRYLMENNSETRTPSYTLLHAGFGTDIVNRKGEKVLTFQLSISNLLDAGYQDHLNRLKYTPVNPATGRQGVFNMGRNVAISMLIPIVFRQ